ncbi:MAG: DUF3419 family protein [Bacteroidota bacterium]
MKQLKNVRHDYIRYANCWEDADVLLEGLQVEKGDCVLSIGSAGDNSFSLLTGDPELVVAVDINPIQLRLIALKKAAIEALEYKDFLQFLGFQACENRLELWEQVKTFLSSDLQQFWSTRSEEIEQGIIHQGKFERYFQLFHSKVLPLIHTSKRIRTLFEEKSEKAQANFYQKRWNNLRWRSLFKVFFSKFVMGKLGRDPQFLKEVEVPVSTFILQQSERHLSSTACQNNYFLHYIMTGGFGEYLPHYARKENYELIKKRLNRLQIFNGLAEDAFREYDSFNKFNLSNIFEYMPPELFQKVTDNLVENSVDGARYAYWNLMVNRRMSEINDSLRCACEISNRLSEEDKGFFYSSVHFDISK